MKRKKIKKIANIIIIQFFIILFVLSIIIIFLVYKNELEEEKLKIENELSIISIKINDILSNTINLLNILDAKDYDFRKAYNFSQNIQYIYYTNNNGEIIIYPKIIIPENFNPKEKGWYIEAIKNGIAITYSYADIEKTMPVITISKKLNEGVLAIDLKPEIIFNIIKNYENSIDLNNIYLIKENGEIIFNDFKDQEYKKNLYERNGLLHINKKIIEDVYLLYIYDIKKLNNKYLKRSLLLFIVYIIFFYIMYNNTKKYINKNFIIPIEKIEHAMKNFNYESKDGIIYLNKEYYIEEINSIIDSYNVLVSTVIASTLNFKLTTDEIRKMYNKVNSINDTFVNIIQLITKLDDKALNLEEYYRILLKNLIETVPEAESGSISIIDNNKWKYITAIGHDIDKLKKVEIDIDKRFFEKYNGIKINSYENLFEVNKKILDDNTYKILKDGTTPFKVVLSYVNYTDRFSLLVSIETNKDRFSDKSIEIFKAFNNISKIFFEKKLELDNIQDIYFKFAEKLASVAEGHDDLTGKHIFRVGEISSYLAEKMGFNSKDVERIRRFAPLHDIGKIYVPYEILNKKDKLTDEEWEEMKMHTIYAKKLLDNDNYFELALNIALYHHENYDGSGYPYGLKGERIPMEAMLVKIADIYDALRSKRSYKDAYSHEKVLEIIINGDDRVKLEHFNPNLLEIFKKYNNEINEIWNKINGGGINEY